MAPSFPKKQPKFYLARKIQMKMKNSNEYEEWKRDQQEQEEYNLWRVEQELKQIPNANQLSKQFNQIFGEKK